MSLRREQPNRYKIVNKENYFLFLDHLNIFLRKKQKSKLDVMRRERPGKH